MVETKGSKNSKIAIGLGLLLVVVVLIALMSKSSGGAYEEVYDQYFYAIQGPNIMQNDGSDAGKLWVSATEAYNIADYESARTHFAKLIETAPRQMNMLDLYYAISSMAIGKKHYTEAKEIFSRIQEQGEGYADQAQWYLALINLAEGDVKESKAILKDIELNDTHMHSIEAKAILTKLANAK